jgi:hypothetical protein
MVRLSIDTFNEACIYLEPPKSVFSLPCDFSIVVNLCMFRVDDCKRKVGGHHHLNWAMTSLGRENRVRATSDVHPA